MTNDLLLVAIAAWLLAALMALTGRATPFIRILLFAGAAAGCVGAIWSLPNSTAAVLLPMQVAGEPIRFEISPDGLWLMGLGLFAAALAVALATPSSDGRSGWLFGAAASLIGALGVFGVRHGAAFLVSWELMSLGGALMILTERLSGSSGRPVLFMLGLLEFGAVALVLGIIVLSASSGSFDLNGFAEVSHKLSNSALIIVGLLFLVGFGAKLGLLPFYEWFPAAYGAGSGATGAIMSGVVLNAAFYGLSRAMLDWSSAGNAWVSSALGILVVVVGIASGILTALYAFQQDDWRSLLSFSSAENASLAVAMLGAALIFRGHALPQLASLAWVVSLLHLGGHALAKGTMFLGADSVFRSTESYEVVHTDLLRKSSWTFGAGTLFAAMSLAAMPPQAGFVSEWYMFQAVFQGFRLDTLGARLVMTLAGAGLALTAAITFATYVKVFGLGLLGRTTRKLAPVTGGGAAAIGVLGLAVLALAVGMPFWLGALRLAVMAEFGTQSASEMRDGLLLVPLTSKFAFISPTLLVIVMPLLALIPTLLIILSWRLPVRRVPVWYGGLDQDPARASTTALTFSNALRTFYSFVYRPTEQTERETTGGRYFIRRLVFSQEIAPIFGPYLFHPTILAVYAVASKLRSLQSGHLNFYLALIGGLLLVILGLVLL